jgi:hypothetical protein
MQKRRTKTLHINQIHAFWICVVLIAATIFLYGYLVNVTILHTATRQSVEDKIIEVKTDISQLELALIETNRSLTEEYAREIGFSSVNELVFVERSSVRSLSLNEL